MKWFVRSGRQSGKTDLSIAIVDELRVQLAGERERNRELMIRNFDVSKLNVELTKEVVRLSQRATPLVDDAEIEDPPTTRDVDMREARRGEQLQTPATKGRHGL